MRKQILILLGLTFSQQVFALGETRVLATQITAHRQAEAFPQSFRHEIRVTQHSGNVSTFEDTLLFSFCGLLKMTALVPTTQVPAFTANILGAQKLQGTHNDERVLSGLFVDGKLHSCFIRDSEVVRLTIGEGMPLLTGELRTSTKDLSAAECVDAQKKMEAGGGQ